MSYEKEMDLDNTDMCVVIDNRGIIVLYNEQ